MSTVGNRRLLKLADKLDTVPRKQFDYSAWVGDDWKGAPDLSCGTTACALGWATTIPSFRRLGLKLNTDWNEVTMGEYRNFYAAALLFELSERDAMYLFAPGPSEVDATPKQVAKKIRQFVKDYP